jgi:OTU domain-containing protein 3
MNETATYGGHLELSAFAHLTRRNVKVVQPGLVYVIEWATGADLSPNRTTNPDLPSDVSLDDREKRRLRREQKRAEQNKPAVEHITTTTITPESSDTIYVAYVLLSPFLLPPL